MILRKTRAPNCTYLNYAISSSILGICGASARTLVKSHKNFNGKKIKVANKSAIYNARDTHLLYL